MTYRRQVVQAYRRIISTVVLLLLSAGAVPAQDDVVMRAMRDELARSMAELQLQELERPYFIAYRVNELDAVSASASFGSLTSSSENRTRMLSVEVRVGDYTFDNTNYVGLPSFSSSQIGRTFGGVASLSLDDDYGEIRRQLWLTTDSVYKQALADLAKKNAALQNRTRTDELADFSQEEAVSVVLESPTAGLSLSDARRLTKELSGLFKEMPDIFTSTVRVSASTLFTRYRNSEGTTVSGTIPRLSLEVSARTQALDGMPLEDRLALYGRALADLPSQEELEVKIRAFGTRLAELRSAELLDRYNGPVLIEGEAAVQLFAQVFAPKLLALRRPVVDAALGSFARMQRSSDFQDRIGARVLPRFLSVIDDPTLDDYQDVLLYGGYEADDQGVIGRSKEVIVRGYLRTLLTGRTPLRDISRSTGNYRGGGVLPSNLLVTVNGGLSDEGLREELDLLASDRGEDFGIVIRRIASPSLRSLRNPLLGIGASGPQADRGQAVPVLVAYKLYADGREVLIRNALISELTAATFREIVAASEKATVATLPLPAASSNPFSFAGAVGSQTPLASLVVPSLLFEELTLKKPEEGIPKLPVAKHPAFAG